MHEVTDKTFLSKIRLQEVGVLSRHSIKHQPLIQLQELNQTTGNSYLPNQQLFDSSIGEVARVPWRAARLSLHRVAFRDRQ